MDKKQAAVYLGKKLNSDGSPISERSVERYIVRFNVPVTRRNVVGADGRKHKVVDISRAELDRIVEQAREAAEEGTMTQPAGSQALAVRAIPPVLTALLDRLAQPAPAASSRPVVPVADKLTLSLAEAAALAGYSKEFLREAIKGKHLKAARGRTRGYNIKRADLLAWIDGL